MKENNFSSRLSMFRQNKNMTQEELAGRMGVTPQALSKWERGHSLPDILLLKELCRILEISADDLLGIENRKITENGNDLAQKEIWHKLQNCLEPLECIFGKDLVPAFLDGTYQEKIVEARKKLAHLGIQDSKQVDDTKIRKLAPLIKDVCPHSILIVPNSKYNDMHDSCNMVDMKCRLHNQAYVNLIHKGYTLPKQIVIDQFVQEKSYYRYLQGFPEVIRGITFETKAENKYLAVACASILARNAFLETWDLMEEKYDFKFEKGAGSKVDVCGKKFVQKFGKEKLYQVAKLHFKNTQKIGV